MVADPIPAFATPLFGAEAIPLLSLDGLYPQEALLKGAAVSLSTDPTRPLDLYNTGHAMATPQLLGVVNSTPRAPGLKSQGAGYDEPLQVICAGRCSVLLAPGLSVSRLQFMEPIGSASPGLWRVAPGAGRGNFQALETINNSGGTQPVFVSGILLPMSQGSGLLGMISSPSPVVTGNVETAFTAGVTIPKNVMAAGKKLVISALVDFIQGNPGDKTILGMYLGGLTGLLIAQTSKATGGTAFVTADQGVMRVELDILTAGVAGKLLSFGVAAIGTPASAAVVLVGKAGPQTLDTTVDQPVVISNTFSSISAANQAVLRALSVELIN